MEQDEQGLHDFLSGRHRQLYRTAVLLCGSPQDAEDLVQETLLAAWRGLGGFEQRASLRAWLYRIATNRCLDARRSASRRPAKQWDVPNVAATQPTGVSEIVWLEPIPDALLEGALAAPGPAARSPGCRPSAASRGRRSLPSRPRRGRSPSRASPCSA